MSTSLDLGRVIDGKYRLKRLIGAGGMGSVYEGENILIRRRVAIKVLNGDSARNEENVRRFEREAQAAGRIGNEHILEVLDLGSLPGGERYIVMEYLDGETLATRIQRHGRLTAEQVAPIALQLLSALASAHEVGIIHRDLKPENVFILRSRAGRADFVKLIDFGISKFSRHLVEGGRRMTQADTVLGTPCYMSPEQARGAYDTDERSDIYSCGVILYEAVTGRVPFDARTFNELMFKIALEDAPSPASLDPLLDSEFAAIVTRALRRVPSARFPSALAFAEAVEEWMRKRGYRESSMSLLGSVSSTSLPRSLPPLAHLGAIPAVEGFQGRDATTMAPTEPAGLAGPTGPAGAAAGVPVGSPGLRKTGNQESWARSMPTFAKERRRRMLISFGTLAGLGLAGLALAIGGSFWRTAATDQGGTSTRTSATAGAATAAIGSVAVSAPGSSAPPTGTTGTAAAPVPTAPSAPAPEASNAAPAGTTRKPRAQPAKHLAPTASIPSTASAPTAHARSPQVSNGQVSNGFELGY